MKLKKTKDGLDFLGYIIRPDYILSRNRVINNYKWKKARQDELDNFEQIQASYLGHLKHCNCQNLREKEKMRKTILILLSLITFSFADFTRDDSQEIVTDLTTGLMWQDNSDAETVTKDWQGAIDYCESLTLGGYSDWRLPNINELRSIVDYDRYNPAIDPVFKNVSNSWYWTSTINKAYTSYSCRLYFGIGYDGYAQGSNHFVRCVR